MILPGLVRGPRIDCTPVSRDCGLEKESCQTEEAFVWALQQPACSASLSNSYYWTRVVDQAAQPKYSQKPTPAQGGKGREDRRESGRKTLSWVSVLIKSSGTSPTLWILLLLRPTVPHARATLCMDTRIRGDGGWFEPPSVRSSCRLYRCPLRLLPTRTFFSIPSPLGSSHWPSWLVPLASHFFPFTPPPLQGDATHLCHSEHPPPPAFTAVQIYADKDVTTRCEGGGLCVPTCMWEGLRKWFGFDGWAVLKIGPVHLSACVCMCVPAARERSA